MSAQQLAQVSGKFGIAAHGVRTSLRGLDSFQLPSILHVNDNHFLAFLGTENGRLILFDNTIGLLDCSPEWFEKRYIWQGDALILGDIPPRWLSLAQTPTFVLFTGGLFLTICSLYYPLRVVWKKAGPAKQLAEGKAVCKPQR